MSPAFKRSLIDIYNIYLQSPCTDTVSPGALQVSTALIDDASVAKKGPQRHLEGMEGASLAVTE